MPVLRMVATHQKIMKILNFILLPKDKVRRKLWLNAIGRVYRHKDGNVDNKRIGHPSHFMVMFAQGVSSLVSLF